MPEETPDSPASLDDSLEERSVGSEIAASTDDLGERPHGETGHDWPGPLEEPPLYPTEAASSAAVIHAEAIRSRVIGVREAHDGHVSAGRC